MKTLATYSIKGGVGKTSAAVNLATIAAERGWRVLLWDLDPQGAATYLFRVKPRVKGGAEAIVNQRRSLEDVVRATDVANLDLVPADFRYRHLDLLLDAVKKPDRRIRRVIRPSIAKYDFVILDCAPSVSLMTEGVLAAADALLVPVIPSTLAVRTIDQLVAFTADLNLGKRAPELIAFFSMYDRRKRLHREIMDELLLDREGLFADASIPSAAVVERMGEERQPLPLIDRRHRATKGYEALWESIEARWPAP